MYCLIFYYSSKLGMLFLFFRSAGNGPDIYKGKICSLKARVRQFMKTIIFAPLIYV